MAKIARLNSPIKVITSGNTPTTDNLVVGELAVGKGAEQNPTIYAVVDGEVVDLVGHQVKSLEEEVSASFEAINSALSNGGSGSGGGSSKSVAVAAGDLQYVRNTMPYNAQPGYRYRYSKGIRLPNGRAGTVVDMSKLFAKLNPNPQDLHFAYGKDHKSGYADVEYDPVAQTITYNEDYISESRCENQVYVIINDKTEPNNGDKLFMAVDGDGAIYICGQYQERREVLAPPTIQDVKDALVNGYGQGSNGGRHIQLQKRVRVKRVGRYKRWWANYTYKSVYGSLIGVFRARFKNKRYTSRWVYVTFHSGIGSNNGTIKSL